MIEDVKIDKRPVVKTMRKTDTNERKDRLLNSRFFVQKNEKTIHKTVKK